MTEMSPDLMADPDGRELRKQVPSGARPDRTGEGRQCLPENLDGYITYSEMQEVASSLGELLHRLVDLYLAFTCKSTSREWHFN